MLQEGPSVKKDVANAKRRFAIVSSSYYSELTHSMRDACVAHLVASGVPRSNIALFDAPGSWEIPLIAQRIAKTKKFDGIATFGVIVKGATYHFDMIANEVGRALMQLSLDYSIPVALEVLAVFSLDHARVRATGEHNRGREAAQALLDTAQVLSVIKK